MLIELLDGEGNGNPLRTLAWKIPWMEEPGRLQSMRLQSQTWLSDFTFTFHFHALEKDMATHSNVLTWRIPGTAKPGGLPSMGSHRVWHNCSDLAAELLEGWRNRLQASLLGKSPDQQRTGSLKKLLPLQPPLDICWPASHCAAFTHCTAATYERGPSCRTDTNISNPEITVSCPYTH